MRISLFWVAVFAAQTLMGCALAVQQAAKDSATNFAKYRDDIRASPEGQMIGARLWLGDSTDTAAKLFKRIVDFCNADK